MTDIVWVISSCVLIAAVIAVRAIFGKRMSAGLRYALWGLVLIRLLIPGTVFSSPISVRSAVENAEVVQNMEAVREVTAITRTETGSIVGRLRRPITAQPDQAPAQTHSPEAQPEAPETAPETAVILKEATPERFERMQKTLETRDILNIIWYTGMGICAAYFIAANLRFYLKLRSRRVRLTLDAGCPVYSVEGLSSSCLFFNSIYIDKETAQDEEKLRYVLAHERAHRRHADGLIALLRSAALVIHWYDPLVWAAAFLSRRDSELFADAGAVRSIGENERESYGRALIELSSNAKVYAPIACAATMMTSGRSELKSRVSHIAKRRRMGFAIAAAVLVLALAAVGCSFLGGSGGEDEPAEPDATEPAVTEAPEVTEPPAANGTAVPEIPERAALTEVLRVSVGSADGQVGYNYDTDEEGVPEAFSVWGDSIAILDSISQRVCVFENGYLARTIDLTQGNRPEFCGYSMARSGNSLFVLDIGPNMGVSEFDYLTGRYIGRHNIPGRIGPTEEAWDLYEKEDGVCIGDASNGFYVANLIDPTDRERPVSIRDEGDKWYWSTPASEGEFFFEKDANAQYSFINSDKFGNAYFKAYYEKQTEAGLGYEAVIIRCAPDGGVTGYAGLSGGDGTAAPHRNVLVLDLGTTYAMISTARETVIYKVTFGRTYEGNIADADPIATEEPVTVPDGYSANDYLLMREFLQIKDEFGVSNGAKLFPNYDPNEPDTWRDASGENYTEWDAGGRLIRFGAKHRGDTALQLLGRFDVSAFEALEEVRAYNVTLDEAAACDLPSARVKRNTQMEFPFVWGEAALTGGYVERLELCSATRAFVDITGEVGSDPTALPSFTVDVTVEGRGFAGAIAYSDEDRYVVKLAAKPVLGADFLGWYDENGALVSEEEVFGLYGGESGRSCLGAHEAFKYTARFGFIEAALPDDPTALGDTVKDAELLLYIPFGEAEDRAGLYIDEWEGEKAGPQCFAIEDGTIYVLDTVKQRVIAYDGEFRYIPIPVRWPTVFTVIGDTIYVSDPSGSTGSIAALDLNGEEKETIPYPNMSEYGDIYRMTERGGSLAVLDHDLNLYVYENGAWTNTEVFWYDGLDFSPQKTVTIGGTPTEVEFNDSGNGRKETVWNGGISFDITLSGSSVTAHCIDYTPDLVFLKATEFVEGVPVIECEDSCRVYYIGGGLKGCCVNDPTDPIGYMNCYFLIKDGEVYALTCREDGVYITKPNLRGEYASHMDELKERALEILGQ